MVLDVSVVRLQHVERPDAATRRFLQYLMENVLEADWFAEVGGSLMIEYVDQNMLDQAEVYAASSGLDPTQTESIRLWVRNLPWDRAMVTLLMET